jgi:hypothetical protein
VLRKLNRASRAASHRIIFIPLPSYPESAIGYDLESIGYLGFSSGKMGELKKELARGLAVGFMKFIGSL